MKANTSSIGCGTSIAPGTGVGANEDDTKSIVMTQSTDYLFNGARDQFWGELYTATA